MCPECLRKFREASPADYTHCKWSRDRLWISWIDYISDLAWSPLAVEPAELSGIAENRGLFRVLLHYRIYRVAAPTIQSVASGELWWA